MGENRVILLYVIGGPARCGKTELALRLLRAHSLPIFSTDLFRAFMEDLDGGGPPSPTSWSDDDYWVQAAMAQRSHDRIRLHLSNLLWMVSGVYENAILEGVEFLPDDVPRLAERHQLRAVFLVRKTVELEALIAHSNRHDWLRDFGPPIQEAVMADIARESADIAERAERRQMTAVDVLETSKPR